MSAPDLLDRVTRLAPGRTEADRIAVHALDPDASVAVMGRSGRDTDDVVVALDVPRRRRTRRALVGVAVASVLGLAAAGLSVSLPPDTPAGPSAAVAGEIEKLAIRAASTPADQVGPGQLVHTVDLSKQDGSGGPYRSYRQDRRESWVRPDGGMWVRSTNGRHTKTYYFPGAGDPGLNNPTPAFLATLPTDPEQLRAYLDDHVQGSSNHDEAVFVAVRDMLRPGYGSPALRAAALRVLTRLPGVDVEHGVSLPTGTSGTALVYTSTGGEGTETTKVLVDPLSARIVGETSTFEGVLGGEPARSTYWTERVRSDVRDAVPEDVRSSAHYEGETEVPEGDVVRDDNGEMLGRATDHYR